MSDIVKISTLPDEIKDSLIWAAISVGIAFGNGDIDASEQYAIDALDSLHAAMEEAGRYAVPRDA